MSEVIPLLITLLSCISLVLSFYNEAFFVVGLTFYFFAVVFILNSIDQRPKGEKKNERLR